ncbi:hypothetical protein SLNSH_04615 [Alsobacter soli]|uniref:Uncharacterized protein n=1 Tax=Alsobacter soli TaxID=2109933 RepID=A0A2T1HWU6_9HYPH|nr:hypothetical protein SLNSH_04615 [Alsobacter soli]
MGGGASTLRVPGAGVWSARDLAAVGCGLAAFRAFGRADTSRPPDAGASAPLGAGVDAQVTQSSHGSLQGGVGAGRRAARASAAAGAAAAIARQADRMRRSLLAIMAGWASSEPP